MIRRTIAAAAFAAALGATAAGSGPALADDAPETIRIGYAISLSGPYAPGAESTTWSQYKLWQEDVNKDGGIYLSKYGKKVPVEFIAYDDRSQIEEAIRLTEKLILDDKVDLVLPPWGTTTNMAVAPVLNKYKYPALHWTSGSDTVKKFSERWPYSFFPLVHPTEAVTPLAQFLAEKKKAGEIEGRIAILAVADQLGTELNNAMTKIAAENGLEIVYNKTYPLGVSDLSAQINEIKALNPDAFFGFSYPTDTFMITEQSIINGFNPKLFYTTIGTPFPAFKAKFGDKVQGIIGYGGLDIKAPGHAEYQERHMAMFNRPAEAGAAGNYATLQILQKAIEDAGEIDREKIRDNIANGTFQTVIGEFRFENQITVNPWAAGQWQDGTYVGIFPKDRPNAHEVIFPKPAW